MDQREVYKLWRKLLARLGGIKGVLLCHRAVVNGLFEKVDRWL